jgi:integrase/recombinase XerD
MYIEHGGDVFKLSRDMEHSDIQVTKKYLEDFASVEARKEHSSFSPIT